MTTVPPANSTPLGMPSVTDIDDAGDDDDHGQRDGVPAPAEKVEVGIFEDMHDRLQLGFNDRSRRSRLRAQILSVAT